MSTTPNLGLTIPVGGTTAGALNNSTVGTYPYIWSANLNLIDSLCYSANNLVPTAGININANLSFNGYGITSASTGSFSSTLTVAGLLSATASGTGLAVTHNATVGGTLGVTGVTTLSGNATVGGTLGVTGATTLAAVTATGVATVGSLTTTGSILTSASGTALSVTTGNVIIGTGNLTVVGYIHVDGGLQLQNSHIIPSGTTVTVASFAGSSSTGWGTTASAAVTGGDNGGIISFETGGTTSAISANTALFVVTLGNAYANAEYAVFASLAQAAGTPDVSSFYAVPTSAGTFTVYNVTGFTPATSTVYKFQFITMGAGATS